MLRWFRSLFAWREYRHSGVWLYEQNDVTGHRRAFKVSSCYQPVDLEWLTAGALPAVAFGAQGREVFAERWTMPPPPRGGSGASRPCR